MSIDNMKVVASAMFSLWRDPINRWKGVLMFFLLINTEVKGQTLVPPVKMAPSPTTPSSSTLMNVLPTPSLLPQQTCLAGPEIKEYDHFLIRTDRIYIDVSEPVNCSGIITRWHYCHRLIGFRDANVALWPCIWRRSNTSESFENIGCNGITIIPGEGDSHRCSSYDPTVNPAELLEVEAGDYIGFYVPDSGILPSLADPEVANNIYTIHRNESGFVNVVYDYETRIVTGCSPSCGRPVLKAEIGTYDIP